MPKKDWARYYRNSMWSSCHIETEEERAEKRLCRGKNAYSFHIGLRKLRDSIEWEEYKAKPHDMWYTWCGL